MYWSQGQKWQVLVTEHTGFNYSLDQEMARLVANACYKLLVPWIALLV